MAMTEREDNVVRATLTGRMGRRDLLKATAAGAAGLALAGRLGNVAAQSSSPAAGLEPEKAVTIEYWQYEYQTKVDLVNELIPEFQKANPKITVKHVNFPYDDFQAKVAAAVQAGEGPDVLNIYYGWAPAYVQQQFLVALPKEVFSAETIKSDFFPMVETVKFGDDYYALPTAVRTLGMFYNKDLLKAAGKEPPKNWEDIVDVAKATVKKNGDKFEIVGITYDPGGQGHQWWRCCLNRQNGLIPISPDHKTLHWSEPAGVEAFKYYMSFPKDLDVTQNGFETDGATAFQNGHAALHVDGSYRIGTYTANAPDLPYGIVPLPSHKDKASFASFWCNAITRNAGEGDKMIAAAKFIDFMASPDVMRRWTPKVGELPARQAVAQEEAFAKDEKLGAFIEQLPYSYATFFVNEAANRQAVMDAMDAVLLQNEDPKKAVETAQATCQQILDDYWANVGS
jgi:multiple sugar transport system substrate-binding protein